MVKNKETAALVAEHLLQIKAIKLNNSTPFIWASGLHSPIYCDNRIALSYPKVRNYIRQQLVNQIREEYGLVDVIAGVATAGIPQGILVAQEMGLPFIYVRSSKKAHGLANQIEGELREGQQVVVVEDLISTGKSSLNAVEAIREAGGNIKGMAAIFTYGLPMADKNFKEANCPLFALSSYEIMIKKAIEKEYISEKDKDSLLEWKKDPQAWSDTHKTE
ncbi:MAG: orotate phosphoribosyltransferase [Bacteroidales bacterium]|jgi:orotate phosphoribosyltransferase|nr:orotate phosphoribosyltransferase [Bacteroidales bacterium]